MVESMSWALWLGLGGLAFALVLFGYVRGQDEGTDLMRELADSIRAGAMTFLRREYSVLVPFVVVVATMLWALIGPRTAAAYAFGAVCSILAGFVGMKAATLANVRTTEAARSHGQAKALRVAFSGGAVMGLAVASLGLAGLGAVLL
ncbi:MAG: sodium/proton-translocating pyrophosphatase, partial [Acidobacteriota bacterium]